jgi:cell division protein FtsW (lipid II flippase)
VENFIQICPIIFYSWMNSTNTTSGVELTFTSGDGVFIGIQALAVVITLFTMLLLCLFRKQKALKTRSISPYIAIVGIWMLIIRFFFWNLSIFRTQNHIGLTYKYEFQILFTQKYFLLVFLDFNVTNFFGL